MCPGSGVGLVVSEFRVPSWDNVYPLNALYAALEGLGWGLEKAL